MQRFTASQPMRLSFFCVCLFFASVFFLRLSFFCVCLFFEVRLHHSLQVRRRILQQIEQFCFEFRINFAAAA